MLIINDNVLPFAEPFTEVNDHPIVHEHADALASTITEQVSAKKARMITDIGQSQRFPFDRSSVYALLSRLPLLCPHCDRLLDAVDYASNVREYGSASINIRGLDDYERGDRDVSDTTISCPFCGDDLNESELTVYMPREVMTLVNEFVTAVIRGDHGDMEVGTTQYVPHFNARPGIFSSQSYFRPGALTGAGMATQCDASVPIATEDIIMADQDLFDN